MAVVALTALFGALGVLYSFLTPIGAAPDEMTHADLTFWIAEGNPYPDFDGRLLSEAAMSALITFSSSDALPNDAAKFPGTERFRELSFGELDPEVPLPNEVYNQMPQHPPLYYEATAGLVRLDRAVSGGPSSWFDEWHRLRILSFVPALVVPLAAWATTRRMGAEPAASVAAAAATLAVPQLLHITSALNNDTYLIVFGAVLAWLLSGVLRRGSAPSTALAVGLVVGLGLLTKAFAVVFPLWVAIVYGRRARRFAAERWRLLRDLVIAGATTAAVAGWWYVGNMVRHGSPVPSTEAWLYTSDLQPPGFEPDTIWYLTRFAAWLPQRFFGWFGWFQVPMGLAVTIIASSFVAAAVAFALSRPSPGVSRGDLVALAAVLPLLVVFVFGRAYQLYVITGGTPFIQGRYLLGGLVPLAVLVAVGVAKAVGRWAPLVVAAGAVAMQVIAIRAQVRGFWGESDDSLGERFRFLHLYNPGPVDPRAWMLIVVVPMAVAALWLAARFARRPPSPVVGVGAS